jgi:uncharacterized protein YjbJ (UPF0337 family)
MNKDRIIGAAKQAAGKVKEVVGKTVGDAKLETEGHFEQVEGKVQNIVGSVKDELTEHDKA